MLNLYSSERAKERGSGTCMAGLGLRGWDENMDEMLDD